MEKKFDFSGWATRANVLCSDGRVITKDAFKHCDGQRVPMVWGHQHDTPDAVLGHAILENRAEGVYAYCKFNDTESAQNAKLCVQNGDIDSLSIFANKLKHQGRNVIHGIIREVSLVLAGANPEARIDSIIMHGEESDEEGYIYFPSLLENIEPLKHADNSENEEPEMVEETKVEEVAVEEVEKTEEVVDGEETTETIEEPAETSESELEHSDSEETVETSESELEHSDDETIEDILNTLTEKQQNAVYAVIDNILDDSEEDDDEEDQEVKHSDEGEDELKHADGDETIADVFRTLSEKQLKAACAMIVTALEEKGQKIKHSDEDIEGGDYAMKRNVFNQTEEQVMGDVLSHDEMKAIMDEAKRGASLKDTILAHGIENLDIMFPEHKSLTNEPEFIKRDTGWVSRVLGGVHHTPFSRIKTIFADITAAEARAKGYQKGNLKIEEVFKLLKRVTNPTTIYKKQKFDRDDVLDINWDMLPFVKREMRMMFDEELARAILLGDGRDPVEEANDKINEECIRPIWKMEDLFTVKVEVPVAADASADDRARAFIKACIKSRKQYKGSGNPDMFMSEDMLTDCLLIEDKNGRVIYDSVTKLAATLRVREIISVPVMDGLTRTDDADKVFTLGGIYVNLKDYNVGTDKGGELNFFDDFDIDYNKQTYLLEGRCSGSLTKPFSAVAIEFTEA